ncbi:MAG: glycosyl transferase [Flavobacteriales bacterium]|nr:glycosyl transferase [Flavobacteriales bacterium]|tara:strand:- start:956 stop:2104 length:1149 start_codon:yes stop_codon:yes gene_type:complete
MFQLIIVLTALVCYTYLGYPVLIVILAKLFPQTRRVDVHSRPSVTWIVPCFNEEAIISSKIENLLALDYPKDKLEIIIITDGSTDQTPNIAKNYEYIQVLHQNRRGGKAAAENRAKKFANGDIIVFNDANTIVSSSALKQLIKHYAEPKVGGVSGAKGIIVKKKDSAESKGEGLYWKYENLIKNADSNFNSLMGAAGELVSFRSELVLDLPEDTILDDFMQSFNVLKKGYIMVYEPLAKAEETSSINVEEELKRKIRIAAGGWQSMSRLFFMLNIFRRPIQAWMYISHRVLRWSITAFALPILYLLNAFALTSNEPFLVILFIAQSAFYFTALIAHQFRDKVLPGPILALYYFVLMNFAVIIGFQRFINGSQGGAWERSVRK